MTQANTFLDAVVAQLLEAGEYNRNDQVAPAAVLWPDEQRQWDPVVSMLRDRLPLLTLGAYDPSQRTGPAYWVRCMASRALPDDKLPGDGVPIVYLPGYGKQDLRAIESCPKTLQPWRSCGIVARSGFTATGETGLWQASCTTWVSPFWLTTRQRWHYPALCCVWCTSLWSA